MVLAVYKIFAILLILPYIHMVCFLIVSCVDVETFSPVPLIVITKPYLQGWLYNQNMLETYEHVNK
jgi:hypothetical protein